MTDEVLSDAPPVTSTVQVIDLITIRTYSDGAVQRNVWTSPEEAQAYADSVAEVEGA
jgi:hypothetical protein